LKKRSEIAYGSRDRNEFPISAAFYFVKFITDSILRVVCRTDLPMHLDRSNYFIGGE